MTFFGTHKIAHCKITSKHPLTLNAPMQLEIELLQLVVVIKCTMYTNVLIKILKFVVEL